MMSLFFMNVLSFGYLICLLVLMAEYYICLSFFDVSFGAGNVCK